MRHDEPLTVVVEGLRRESGMSGRELARRAGITPATLNRRLTQGGWKVDELPRLAAVFGLTASQLAARVEDVAA